MKKTAKLLAALLATLLCLACAIPAFAELNPANPSTGLPWDTGNLTVHKYTMPDLDLANLPNDGGEIQSTPKTTPNGDGYNDYNTTIPASAIEIAGIRFNVYRIDFASYTENRNLTNAPLDSVYRQLIDDFNQMGWALDKYLDTTVTPTVHPTQVISAAKNPNSTPPDQPFVFPVSYVTTLTSSGYTFTTDKDGNKVQSATTTTNTDTATDLPKGFYLVVEELNDLVSSISYPFIVAIPMTNAEGDGWIKNVHVYPKNSDITISKTIDRNAVHVGELVNFSVTVSVPADIRTYYDFFMTDQLDECLTYKTGSMKVYGIGAQHAYDIWNPANPINLSGGTMNFDPNTVPAGGGTLIPAKEYSGSPPTQVLERYNFTVWEPNPPADVVTGKNENNTVRVEFWKNLTGTTPHGESLPRPASATNPVHASFTPDTDWQESRQGDRDGFWTLRQYNYIRFEFSAYINEKILDRAGVNPYPTNSSEHQKGNYWGDNNNPNRWPVPADSTTSAQSWAYTIFNQATINFRNKFDYKADKDRGGNPRYRHRESNFVKTHTAALYIEKIDANTGVSLEGAKFKIADCEACARNGRFLRLVYKDNTEAAVATTDAAGYFQKNRETKPTTTRPADQKYFTVPLNNKNKANTPARVPGSNASGFTNAGVATPNKGSFVSIEAPFLPGTSHGTVSSPGTPDNTLWSAAGSDADWIEETKFANNYDFNKDTRADATGWNGKAIARFEGLKEFGVWNQVYNSTLPPPIFTGSYTAGPDMEETPFAEKGVTTASTGYLTYWLVEVQAPPVPGASLGANGIPQNGLNRPYNLLLEPIEIGFSFDNDTIPKHISNFDNWYTINGGVIRNTNKFTLPRTGGMGTILFTAGGVAIIGVAVFLFILSMRKKKGKDKA